MGRPEPRSSSRSRVSCSDCEPVRKTCDLPRTDAAGTWRKTLHGGSNVLEPHQTTSDQPIEQHHAVLPADEPDEIDGRVRARGAQPCPAPDQLPSWQQRPHPDTVRRVPRRPAGMTTSTGSVALARSGAPHSTAALTPAKPPPGGSDSPTALTIRRCVTARRASAYTSCRRRRHAELRSCLGGSRPRWTADVPRKTRPLRCGGLSGGTGTGTAQP